MAPNNRKVKEDVTPMEITLVGAGFITNMKWCIKNILKKLLGVDNQDKLDNPDFVLRKELSPNDPKLKKKRSIKKEKRPSRKRLYTQ